jgi:hypothetical protein
VLLGLAAYADSLSGPFVYDDLPAIAANPTLRHLWPLSAALHPPAASTVTGRPLLNLSFAFNYALGGTAVGSYHALNVLIHLLAGLCLFGCVRRTLDRGPEPAPAIRDPTWAAAVVAAIWTVHPLLTEAVTYVAQRAESLMGLCYLGTLYTFIRGTEARTARRAALWLGGSVALCAAGMAIKEVMVTAPALVLLYDRTFAAGGFRAAWRRRWCYYLGLAATWIPLGLLLAAGGGNRNGSIGFGIGVSPWSYAATQVVALPRYLWLSVWPHPLIFEYGPAAAPSAAAVIAGAIGVGSLLIGTLVATWHRRATGFLGCWFFGILAPTSSFIPGATQSIVEHRMYLPLAAVVVLAVIPGFELLTRRATPAQADPVRSGTSPVVGRAIGLTLVLASVLAGLTARRNLDYRTELALWTDTVSHRPMNPVAHDNLGAALLRAGDWPAAEAEFTAALRLRADDPEAHNALGSLMVRLGRRAEAIAHFQAAVRLAPDYADAHFNLALALAQTGRLDEGAGEAAAAVRLRPDDAQARALLAAITSAQGEITGAPRR